MIKSYSDFTENNRLQEQIHELKEKNSKGFQLGVTMIHRSYANSPFSGEQSRQIRELVGASRTHEKERSELETKYEELMRGLEEKSQELKAAERRGESLQARLNQLDQLQEELRIEVGASILRFITKSARNSSQFNSSAMCCGMRWSL